MPQKWRRGRGLLVAIGLALVAMLVLAGTGAAAGPTLSPTSQTVVLGQTAQLVATESPDQNMTFTVTSGPNAGQTFQTVTDSNGEAFFDYSSSQAGTDHVTATDASGAPSNDATVTWTPPALVPASSTRTVGQSITLTAIFGQDHLVTFTVTSGPNAGMTSQTVTDLNGQATFTYSSSQAGTDTVSASDGEVSTNNATVTWNPVPPPKTDVGVSLSGPSGVIRVGEKATWTASVSNAGPDTATGVTFQGTAPAGGTLVSATTSRGNGCSGSSCAIGTLGAGESATVTLVYSLAQAGTVSVAASVQGDYDTNTGNNAASAAVTVLDQDQPPPPPPPPSQPGTFNAIPTGTVTINGVVQTPDQLFNLPSGSTIDVTNGILTLTEADGSTASFSAGEPTSRTRFAPRAVGGPTAQFTIQQPVTGGTPTLTLTGGDFSACTSPRSLSANSKPVRALWGSAKGNFTTKGKFAAATVRGTIWLVEDRCDGTLTQVVEGLVAVNDTVRNKTVLVSAGDSYLSTPRAALTVRVQTPKEIAKRGLLYAGHYYKTKAAFTVKLKALGYTWAEFAKRYPALAAALSRRS